MPKVSFKLQVYLLILFNMCVFVVACLILHLSEKDQTVKDLAIQVFVRHSPHTHIKQTQDVMSGPLFTLIQKILTERYKH